MFFKQNNFLMGCLCPSCRMTTHTNGGLPLPVIGIDASTPEEIAESGICRHNRINLGALTLFVLEYPCGGLFIALGTQLFVLVTHTATSSYGLNQLVGGVAFTLAMVLIVITGAELFFYGRPSCCCNVFLSLGKSPAGHLRGM